MSIKEIHVGTEITTVVLDTSDTPLGTPVASRPCAGGTAYDYTADGYAAMLETHGGGWSLTHGGAEQAQRLYERVAA